MKNSLVALTSELLKLLIIIGATLKNLDDTSLVRQNLVAISVGLSKIASITLDFEGEPTEGVNNG